MLALKLANLAALLALILCAACASIPQSGPVRVAPEDNLAWQSVLREHTRRDEPYRETTIREADLRATLVTPRLRKAFIDQRASMHGRFARDIAKDLVGLGDADEGVDAPMKSGPDAEQQVIIFAAMYVADQKNRDLAASYTIWDTRLVRGTAQVKPIKIETVKMSPAVQELFPYVDRFDDLYVMRFPLVDGEGHSFEAPGKEPLKLLVSSALADAVVSWDLVE